MPHEKCDSPHVHRMSDILPEAAITQPNASKLASRQMSHSIRSWLVPAIIQHHKAYGLDLGREEQGHYVQILEVRGSEP